MEKRIHKAGKRPALMQPPEKVPVTSPDKGRVRKEDDEVLHFRKLNKSGGLTVPRMMRQELGLHPGTALDLITTEDGGLLIQKHAPSCHVCGSTDDIGTYRSLSLCRGCYDALGKELNRNG